LAAIGFGCFANSDFDRGPEGDGAPPADTGVLRGAFEDESGAYHRGDLQEVDEEIAHQPLALPQEDCICLAITDAPLRFKSLAARIAQPFLGI
jgi:putative transcriptional regulator